MSNSNKDFSDPKIQLILSIQRHDDYITERLEKTDEVGAALAMALLLRRLALSDGDKEMIKLRNSITIKNYDSLSAEFILNAYATIHRFLNTTYYAGFRAPMGESFFKDLEEESEEP